MRAFAAYVMGLVPNFPGFINSIVTAGGKPAPIGAAADYIVSELPSNKIRHRY